MSGPAALPAPIAGWRCRWCGGAAGSVTLDLGRQPAADFFPLIDEPRPDPEFDLRMVLCAGCGLAQLEDDPTRTSEPRGVEPQALVRQSEQAVADLVAAGLAGPGMSVTEFPSPHGGSWTGLLTDRGLHDAPVGPADLLVDSFGMMHAGDQRAALRRRVARMTETSTLVVHFHSLATILRLGTWNALRHGHFGYYSTPTLVRMAGHLGLVAVGVWEYELYGGTVMLAFRRDRGMYREHPAVGRIRERETAQGVLDSQVVASLGADVRRSVADLRTYLQRSGGDTVAGYGAASRAVALLHAVGAEGRCIRAIGDVSPAKRGRALPGSRIPILDPAEMVALRPAKVLLFVPDLLAEVRTTYPEIEANGGRWVVVEPTVRVMSVR